MTTLSVDILPEAPQDGPAVDRLHERTFGPGRFARSAYRLREGVPADPALSFIARVGTFLVGSVRMTPILIGEHPALLLGPLTVEPAFEKRGIGAALTARAIEAATAAGHRLVLLVGDEAYYRRFGFQRVPRGRVTLPGPVDPDRVLVRECADGAFAEVSGPADIDHAWAEIAREVS